MFRDASVLKAMQRLPGINDNLLPGTICCRALHYGMWKQPDCMALYVNGRHCQQQSEAASFMNRRGWCAQTAWESFYLGSGVIPCAPFTSKNFKMTIMMYAWGPFTDLFINPFVP